MICPQCEGTGWRPIDENGVRRVERCGCWQSSRTADLLANARIDQRYARCTLQSFVAYDNEHLQIALAKARRFAREFPAVERGLILTGPPGIGKTHIAVAILRQVITEKAVRGLFYDVPNLLRLIRSTYNPVVRTAEMDVLRPVMESELLVLDDLGGEKPSEWVEETINLIVNTRYNQRLPTIFTTNYEVLEDATDMHSLQVRVGFRMWSRLHEMCEFLEFSGLDYRMLEPNVGVEEMSKLWKQKPRRSVLPSRAGGQVKAEMRPPTPAQRGLGGRGEIKWPGGKLER